MPTLWRVNRTGKERLPCRRFGKQDRVRDRGYAGANAACQRVSFGRMTVLDRLLDSDPAIR